MQSSPVAAFLRQPAPEAPFDLVFCDPPYGAPTADIEHELAVLADARWVTPDATVVLECRASSRPALPAGWRVGRELAHGDTLLVVATV